MKNVKIKKQHQLIETQTKLKSIARELKQEKILAVDIESDSMYHFREKVCLIQISSRSSNFIIDPLKIRDISSIKTIFSRKDIKKVFHGADYDVRSLFRDYQFEIHNLFDTHLACRYLGYKETGLEATLKHFFNVSINKRYQKKDWSRRPLPQDMIDYAASDAIYLLPLFRILEKDLKKINRLYWVNEECEVLSQVRPASPNSNPLYLSYKGAGNFSFGELAVLEKILQLRKKIARKKDKPPFKIFQNSSINKIVQSKPISLRRLAKTNAFSQKQIEMYGNLIIKAVDESLKIPKNELPYYPKKKSKTLRIADQKRIKLLKTWKEQKAEELKIDPALVSSKSLLTAIAVSNPKAQKDLEKIKEMKNWQIKEFGEDILYVLNKEYHDGKNRV